MHCLNARSHFSIGTSILSPKAIVAHAAEHEYDAVILTDNATISGMTALFGAARSQDPPIKAVIGVSIAVFDDPTYRPPSKKSGEKAKPNPSWEAKLLVKNDAGIKVLYQLLSKANSEEYFYYRPRIGLKDLIVALQTDSLILTTGDLFPLFSHHNYIKILDVLVKTVSASNLAVELVPVRSAYFDKTNKLAAQGAIQHGLRVIYSRPALYKEGQADARDVMSYISSHGSANARLRPVPYNRDLCLLDPETLYKETQSMLNRLSGVIADDAFRDASDEIVAQCEYEWHKSEMCLPVMADDEFGELIRLCKVGWAERLTQPVFGYMPPPELLDEYKDRLAYELKILRDMGFDRYFLLVRDVIMWSKENGILVGPARGSSAGSLVAFLLGITDVDPLRFGLIFERFLNPDRLDYPDIDSDFMSSRRHEVIEYLVDKYGADRVAGISNYTMLGPASAIRDVGRIYGLSMDQLRPTKAIEQNSSWEAAIELPEIINYAEAHPAEFAISAELAGSMRALGRHAAGIVVAGEPLRDRAVVETRKGEVTVNHDKRTVEDFGLIKLDILGLSTLDIIQLALEKIQARHGETPDLNVIPLDDDKVLQAFAEGRTIGVFQYTGGGMRHLLKDLAYGGRKLTFEDVYAASALFRPGPLQSGMTDEYIRVKQGIAPPHYEHPNMEAALVETRGIIVYQEQVMQIARDLCGYTMGESDTLRKIMGKKLPEEMEKQRDKFTSGAVETSGLDADQAAHIFDTIAEFAGYGFNKSHSCAYALVSYQCMWLKTYYPAEFYAATLSIVKEDDLTAIVKDAAAHEIYVVPPDINHSTASFEIGFDTKREQHILYAPLNRVKQVSDKGTQMILAAREAGPFLSKADFLSRIQARLCNSRAQGNLDKVGAFASLDPDAIDPRHPDRLKDQKELIPNLMMANVKPDRKMDVKAAKAELQALFVAITEDDENAALPNFGAKPKFMLLTDCAAYSEVEKGKFAEGKSFGYVNHALKAAGLKKSEGYYSGLVKVKKASKSLSSTEIAHWSHYLDEEIALLKPALIVACGGAVIRHLCPDVKGGWESLAGQVIYDAKLDVSIFFAPNPQMAYIREEAQEVLDAILIDVRDALDK